MPCSLVSFLDFFGIAVFAMSGALTAGNKRLDIFGVLVIALVTCLGGGTLRDVILDSHPVVWIENTSYLLVAIVSAFVTFILMRSSYRVPARMLEVCDAIGLAFFAMAGMKKTQLLGYSPEITLIMGVMRGVVGGMIRDVVCNEIPLIFHKEIYAVAAIAGGAVFLLLQYLGIASELSMVIGMLTILTLRLMGVFMGLSMPVYFMNDEQNPH